MGFSNSRQLSVDSGKKKEETSVEARISGQGEVQKLSSNMRFEELPHSLLAEIASYTRSRNKKGIGSDVLLAIAMSGSAKSWEQCQSTDTMQLLSPASKAVLSMNTDDWGKRFEEFDFGQLQYASGSKKSPHEKLNDVVLKAALICIDAVNNIKSLKLTGCVGVSGSGLEPIRMSTMVERIDISLVSIIVSKVDKTSLSEDIVLPILRSVLGGSSSLKHIQLPLSWRNERSPELSTFMEEYNEHLENMSISCQHKTRGRPCANESEARLHTYGERYGVQSSTCYDCMKHSCSDESHSPKYCPQCQKYHCNSCDFVCNCLECFKASCLSCHEVHICQECYMPYCDDCKTFFYCMKCFSAVCSMECRPMAFCMKCYHSYCLDCAMVSFCEGCNTMLCNDCESMTFSGGKILCCDCI